MKTYGLEVMAVPKSLFSDSVVDRAYDIPGLWRAGEAQCRLGMQMSGDDRDAIQNSLEAPPSVAYLVRQHDESTPLGAA